MLAVTAPGFVVFAALLAGLWYLWAPARRWQLMLAASAVFYLSLDWQGFVVLVLCAVLVWLCALRVRGKRGWLVAGLAAALGLLRSGPLCHAGRAPGGLRGLAGRVGRHAVGLGHQLQVGQLQLERRGLPCQREGQ